jgi:hypothetical protein
LGAALLTTALLVTSSAAQTTALDEPDESAAAAATAADALHATFTEVLARHVKAGVVDYTGLAKNAAALDSYIQQLERARPGTGAVAFAYWINAYNAFTLRLILDHHPKIDSIKDISSSDRWKAKRWKAGGRLISLDAIEHEILRPMGDPRIHFAINCASISCPDLRSEAYLPTRLDKQLDDATRRFLSSPSKGSGVATESAFFGGENYILRVSKIFDWFEDDFVRWGGGVVSFVERHAPTRTAAFIATHRDDLELEEFDYDWSLNGR